MTTTPTLGLTQYEATDTIDFLTQYNTDLDKIDDYAVATNTNIGTLASLKTAVKTSTVGAINEVYDTTDNGWISARATLTHASASAPTFVCNTSTNLTTRISVGMKIKLTQTTAKYFFVTAITSTTITLYGGTDYVVANATISNVYYSVVKSPLGFPLNPDKWSVKVINITSQSVTSPSTTYKQVGTLNISIPIGIWKVDVSCCGYRQGAIGIPETGHYTALSTSNTSSTHNELVHLVDTNVTTPSNLQAILTPIFISSIVSLEQQTIFYVIMKSISPPADVLSIRGELQPTIIKATCAYL